MNGNEFPYLLDPIVQPTPIWMSVSDINSIDSFFIFMDAAIRCHPFVLVGSFTLTLFFIYIVVNNREIYHRILCGYSNYLYNKGGE